MAEYINVEKPFLETLRQWATQRPKAYLVKDFAINQKPSSDAN